MQVIPGISIFQSEGFAGPGQTELPYSFLALKDAYVSGAAGTSSSCLSKLQQFIGGDERHALIQLRGPAAAKVADLLDEVRKPYSTTISRCD